MLYSIPSMIGTIGVVALAAASTLPTLAMAQTRAADRTGPAENERRVGGLPRDVSLEAVALWNAAATRRVRGDFTLLASDTVRGDLAVLRGKSRISGVVLGQLLAINGDVTIADSGRVQGVLTVLGGALDTPNATATGGEVRVWSARLRYRESGDSLTAELDHEFFSRWSRWPRASDSGTKSELLVTTANAYNRVEGLPLLVGPRLRASSGDTRATVELYGVFRTGDRLSWETQNRGHRVLVELQQGQRAGVRVGGRLFDVVDAVEQWQLTDQEVGLAAFLATRDYRDYWRRHGASGHVALFAGRALELRAEYGQERWSARQSRGIWSIFNDDVPWRPNPDADEGVLHLASAKATIDTRNSVDTPRRGWLVSAVVERGSGTLTRLAPTTVGVRTAAAGATDYTRGLLDVRRYNQLAPGARLNLRAVLGGWLAGDALPAQRRFSTSGIDALPGFDFRRSLNSADVGTCATGSDAGYAQLGRPAQCERMVLLQAEWKGDFRIRLFGDRDWFGDRRRATTHRSADGAWVVFANSGRGWLVHGTDANLRFAREDVPPLNSWRTDLGGGFDFGDFGVYLAQAVSQSGLSPNLYVRLGRRF